MHVLVFVFPTVWFIVGSFLLPTSQKRQYRRLRKVERQIVRHPEKV